MGKEPVLEFKLSRSDKFHCSSCRDTGDEGAFTLDSSVAELVDAFRAHVERYHSKGEDFNKAAK